MEENNIFMQHHCPLLLYFESKFHNLMPSSAGFVCLTAHQTYIKHNVAALSGLHKIHQNDMLHC